MNQQYSYINSHYGLKLKKGTKFTFKGQNGTVQGVSGSYVVGSFDSNPNVVLNFHPTWEMTYLKPEDKQDEQTT